MRARLVTFLCGLLFVTVVSAEDHKTAVSYKCPKPDDAFDCVMSGLDNPRGLAFGPAGALYVAEAGRGAGHVDTPAQDPRCFISAAKSTVCYGATGAITRLWRGKQERIVDGLSSWAFPGKGNSARGPSDIAFLGQGDAVFTMGWENDSNYRFANSALPDLVNFATLVGMSVNGEYRYIVDIGQFEAEHNPDNYFVGGNPVLESDPYGILPVPGGWFVVDAGSNALLRIDRNREISLVATFPSRGSNPPRMATPPPPAKPTATDSVPTCITVGPDGAYYIGELTGLPFVAGAANIYRLDPEVDAVPHEFKLADAFLTGFKAIMDITFDDDGTLYVVEHATSPTMLPAQSGALIAVFPDKTQSNIADQYRFGVRKTVIAHLNQPTSVVVGPDGDLYVTNNGQTADTEGQTAGEVIRIPKPTP